MYVALVTYSKCIGCSGYLQQVYLLRMLGKPQGDGGNKDVRCAHILGADGQTDGRTDRGVLRGPHGPKKIQVNE